MKCPLPEVISVKQCWIPGLYNKSGSGDGSQFKAVLLSGPPGIGKTTTAILACKETGISYVHMNASDSRSKRILSEQYMSGVTSHSLLEYGKTTNSDEEAKSALIMDEVDGMAGNEDRGGIQVRKKDSPGSNFVNCVYFSGSYSANQKRQNARYLHL